LKEFFDHKNFERLKSWDCKGNIYEIKTNKIPYIDLFFIENKLQIKLFKMLNYYYADEITDFLQKMLETIIGEISVNGRLGHINTELYAWNFRLIY
jgi:hypothetical protein